MLLLIFMHEFEAKPFGTFFLLNKIAQGGMAEIFVAKDSEDACEEEIFVIKRLLKKYSDNKKFVTMLIDEAKITSLLEHPKIVKIFDIGTIGRDFYIMLEYINGKSLDLLIQRMQQLDQKIPLEVVSFILDQTAKALDYAHSFTDSEERDLHLVHRDVTPGNILLSYDGEVKLADFGIATAGRDTLLSKDDLAFGKKFYMPPEQLTGDLTSKKIDIYSLGAVVYEMVTGSKIFKAKSEIELQEMIKRKMPQKPSEKDSKLKDLDGTILKALKKEPEDRYESTLEFAKDFSKTVSCTKESPLRLAKLLRDSFTKEREENEITIKESIKLFEDYMLAKGNESEDNTEGPSDDAAQKTQFLSNEYVEAKTSFLPKDKFKEIQKSAGEKKTDSKKKPIIKIKTKKVTKEEYIELKKQDADEQVREKEWEPELTMMPTKDKTPLSITPPPGDSPIESPVEAEEDESPKTEIKSYTPPIDQDKDPSERLGEISMEKSENSLLDKIEDKISKEIETLETEDIREDAKPDKREESEPEVEKLKPSPTRPHTPLDEPIEPEVPVSKKFKKFIAPTIILTAAVVFIILFINFFTQSFSKIEHPLMNAENPQDISVIIFANKPNDYEKGIFRKILRTRPDRRYDNFGSIKTFFENEYSKFKKARLNFVNLSVIGPVEVTDRPPEKLAFFEKSNVYNYFTNKFIQENVTTKKGAVRIYTFFYRKEPEEVPFYPITYKGFLEPGTQIVFLPLIKENINDSIIMLANRILATFGATEKLDSGGNPIYPDGYVDPNADPLYPQTKAEIMARYTPLTKDSAKIPNTLSDLSIGAKTALEIGWINEAEYNKFMSKKNLFD